MNSVTETQAIRTGECAVDHPGREDAALLYIGRIHTPWSSLSDCPRQGRADGPLCRIDIDAPWQAALDGVTAGARLEVLYWLHRSRRDLVRQSPKDDGVTRGTFSIRSPIRPNPIGTSIVAVERVEGGSLFVRGLDCIDGTPLLDLKPDRVGFTPYAHEKPADSQTG